MSSFQRSLLIAVAGFVLASAGCASRPARDLAAKDTCGPLAASLSCDTSASFAGHPYRTVMSGTSADADLSLPPKSLGTVETLVQSSDVKAALARSAAAYTDIAAARARNMPQVSFDATGSTLNARRDPRSGSEPDRSYSYALTIDVPIYQGGRNTAALGIAESEFRASTEVARDTLLSTALSLLTAQAQVQRQTEIIAIVDRHRQQLRRLRANVVGERDAGTATSVDIGEVDRQLLRLEVDQKQARLQRAQAEETLHRLNAPRTLRADAAMPDIAAHLPKALPELIDTALRNNPRIAARLAQMDAAQARVDEAEAAYNPNLGLSLTSIVEGTPSNSTDRYEESKAMLRLSVPLYTGGAREAGIKGRNEEFLASALEKDSALMGVYAAVQSAFDRKTYALEMLALARKELRVSRAQIESVKSERNLGERSVFDEIRAIADTATAEIDVSTAGFEVRLADYILAAETGMLTDIIGVKLESVDQVANVDRQ